MGKPNVDEWGRYQGGEEDEERPSEVPLYRLPEKFLVLVHAGDGRTCIVPAYSLVLPPTFKSQKARKTHDCRSCGGVISPGEQYWRCKGLVAYGDPAIGFDPEWREWDSYASHPDCQFTDGVWAEAMVDAGLAIEDPNIY